MPDDVALETEPLPPLDGVPDWISAFLLELRDNPDHFGSISRAANAAGHTRASVTYWRNKHPAFNTELTTIRNDVLDAIIDELEHLALKFAIGGITETTDEKFTPVPDDDGYRYVKKTKITWDIKHIQWLLERLYKQRYGPQDDGLARGGNITFTFKLGDNDNAGEIEGEVIGETETPALPPAPADRPAD